MGSAALLWRSEAFSLRRHELTVVSIEFELKRCDELTVIVV